MSSEANSKPLDPKQILAMYADPKDAIKRVEALKAWRSYCKSLLERQL